MLKKTSIVRLFPPALFEDAAGQTAPADDEWKVENVDEKEGVVTLYNLKRGLRIPFNQDHFNSFMSGTGKTTTGEKWGYLRLSSVEVFITPSNGYRVTPAPLVPRNKPRSLTPDQRGILVDKLKGLASGPLRVMHQQGDNEASAFAGELKELLRAGGYEVTGIAAITARPMDAGLTLALGPAPMPFWFSNLQNAFEAAGLHAVVARWSEAPAPVTLIVGPKP